MIGAAILGAVGGLAGFALVLRVPKCQAELPASAPQCSIIIPARNEEHNLPRLLKSIIESTTRPAQVIVVDDASTDGTATVARGYGAFVVASSPLPDGWTGKTWACFEGAKEATSELLLFLDADVYFAKNGFSALMAAWMGQQKKNGLALSVLPYHQIATGYEQLSVIFNVLMAAGAGGFSILSEPSLFGQSLLIPRALYFETGGHQAVRNAVLENLKLTKILRQHRAQIISFGGAGTLQMRMFPAGFRQMSESWSKAFVDGAKDSGKLVVSLSIVWISALWSCALLLLLGITHIRSTLAVIYVLSGFQLYVIARQLGRYSLVTCLLYPIPLGYYCFVFGRSMINRALGHRATWKGREL